MSERYALIAGNGQFPLLVLREARRQGVDMVVLALREETAPEIEQLGARVHWVSLGELQKALGILRQEAVHKVVLAGQVKHTQIFSDIPPDPVLKQLLALLPKKNSDALIGTIARALEMLGIEVVDSTLFVEPLLPAPGPLSQRAPDAEEEADIAYGRHIAREIARLDLGQTVVVSQRACVAIEAMEGTDATIERAGRLVPPGGRRRLVVVKVSKPQQDMRFDVPVVGLTTLDVMKTANATALALDAGRTLIFDREEFTRRADEYNLAVVALAPDEAGSAAEKPGS
ncbi:MAG TPA: UDP-2,3-diacylglucosamine diphosphatase LpxI [Candidatus Acidoferrales bacterium]|nr:UDP-2,3-diacylglucosamine diphosphatase LpxI [Candidatus Acidoferrales bacterium]